MSSVSSDIFAPITYGLFSIFLWSLSASIADYLTGDVNYLAFTVGILICGLFFFGVDCYRNKDYHQKEYTNLSQKEKLMFIFFVFLFGVLLVIYDLSFYYSIQEGPSVPANLINYLWPVLTPIFAVYLFQRPGDNISYYEFVALLLAFIGAIIAIWDFSSGFSFTLSDIRISYLAALVAALSAALYLNALDVAQDYIPSISLTYFVGILFGLPLLLIITPLLGLNFNMSADSIPIVVFYGFVGFAGGQLAWGRAITRGNKVVISALAYLTPILSTLFLFVLVDATITQSMAAGGTLIIIANVLLNDSFRHVSSVRGAIIAVFAISIVLFVDPEIGGAETTIGVFEGFVATIFAILAGFMLDRVWQVNEKENKSLVSINSSLKKFQPLLTSLPQEDQDQVLEQIDQLMQSILSLNYLKDSSMRYKYSRQIYENLDEFDEIITKVFENTTNERRATYHKNQLREDINNWLMLNQERVSIGEMSILWILGAVTIVLFIINTGVQFIENLIAIALSGVIVFIILKIRDYNLNRTGTEKALIEQDILIQIGKRPYFPSKEMVLDGGYINTMSNSNTVRLGQEQKEQKVEDLTPHIYVRYCLYVLVAVGIFIILAMVYISSLGTA